MIFKIPQFSILFALENHFFTEVSISTKKNLKAEMPNFPTKFSKQNCPRGVLDVGGLHQHLLANIKFRQRGIDGTTTCFSEHVYQAGGVGRVTRSYHVL